MDKTTKAFVIAACSVVIAIPVVWIRSQVREANLIEFEQRLDQEIDSEKQRQTNREWLCQQRADWDEQLNAAWVGKCMRSTAPVDEV